MLKQWMDCITVICCSIPRRDPIRVTQFHKAAGILGAHESRVLPGQDNGAKQPLDLSALNLSCFDYVLTHNEKGEYGNPHHVQVHKHIVENFRGPKYFFGYGIEQPDKIIRLDETQSAVKLAALQCYSFATAIDKMPKWQALINRYFQGKQENLMKETYVVGR